MTMIKFLNILEPQFTYLLVLEGLLQRQGVAAVAHRGDKDTGSRSSGKYSLA